MGKNQPFDSAIDDWWWVFGEPNLIIQFFWLNWWWIRIKRLVQSFAKIVFQTPGLSLKYFLIFSPYRFTWFHSGCLNLLRFATGHSSVDVRIYAYISAPFIVWCIGICLRAFTLKLSFAWTFLDGNISASWNNYILGCPPSQDASHHQDYCIFSRGSRTKPSFATGILGGGTTQIIFQKERAAFVYLHQISSCWQLVNHERLIMQIHLNPKW